jgi:hypothetical protein
MENSLAAYSLTKELSMTAAITANNNVDKTSYTPRNEINLDTLNSTNRTNTDLKSTDLTSTRTTDNSPTNLAALNGNYTTENVDPDKSTKNFGNNVSTDTTDGKNVGERFLKMFTDALDSVTNKNRTGDNSSESEITSGENGKLDGALDEAGVSKDQFESAAHEMGPELKKEAEEMKKQGMDSDEILGEVTDKVLESIGSDLDGLSAESQMQLTNFCSECLGEMANEVTSNVDGQSQP